MSDELTAEEVRSLLDLEPNATCGFVRGTYVSGPSIAAGGLPPPFANQRPMGSALYFLVTPTAPVRLHRIRNDQLYHYYLGDPLEVFLLYADGSTERVIVGPDLRKSCAASHSRQYLSYRAGDRASPLVSRSEHRVARGGAHRCRDRQCRCDFSEISRDRRHAARHCGLRRGSLSRARKRPPNKTRPPRLVAIWSDYQRQDVLNPFRPNFFGMVCMRFRRIDVRNLIGLEVSAHR